MTKFVIPAVPSDPAVLQALGEVALRQAHVDNALRMMVKTLAELDLQEGLDATARENSSSLRRRVRKLAKQRFGEGQALCKVQALVERARRATQDRNTIMHSVCGRDVDDGITRLRGNDHTWGVFPSVEKLRALTNELRTIADEMNHERLEGFVAEAMKAQTVQSKIDQ